ncbi:hypothetical protein AB205_0071820 [Aquarana catesbeiana]|uniref:Large ribosomal subunit protein uL10 n=1 Tax=Aquarana catesbeiana TaxID=8400 RepID=A0A2G9RHT6_AQUCT|nr:hypothetical protein AB205_0071820 [Aquarana catesbeiana]
MLLANKVPASARAGAIAPCDVTVPAQNTGLGPEKTSFFQALGITTKISRGTIEILRIMSLQVKAFLADPSAFVVAAPVAETAAAPAASAAPAKEEKEESEESDDDMGFGLFD